MIKINDFLNICSKKHFKYLLLLLFLMFVAAGLEMLGLGSIPLFIMLIIDINTLTNHLPEFLVNKITGLEQSYITILGGTILITIFLFKNLFLAMFLFIQGKIIKMIRTDVTNKLFKNYVNATYNFHIKNNPAILIRNITYDTGAAINVILSTLSITRETLVIIVVFILLLINKPIISLSVFSFLLILSGSFYLFTRKRLHNRGLQFVEAQGNQIKVIEHALGSIRETKVLNRENYLTKLFNKQVSIMEQHQFFQYFLTVTPRLFLESISITALALISIIFVIINLTTEQILPTISLLAVCALRLIPAFNLIVSMSSGRTFATASFKIISNELKNVPVENKFKDINLTIDSSYKFKNKIKFEKVFFQHENVKKSILEDISLEIEQGKKIGFIGKSGAGKSTLIDLILGLIKPTEGKILIDNKDINDNLNSWQKQIGYVPQEIYLLDESIKNNIAFGLDYKDINHEAVLKSIKLANLENFVNSLDDKENTIIGNRGIKVSGGQKQRIGIARALYNNPRILILDEATSSLDTMNEKEIMKEIYNSSTNRTLIIITHRHTSVFNCDEVFLLDKGKIIDKGKYKDLKDKHLFN